MWPLPSLPLAVVAAAFLLGVVVGLIAPYFITAWDRDPLCDPSILDPNPHAKCRQHPEKRMLLTNFEFRSAVAYLGADDKSTVKLEHHFGRNYVGLLEFPDDALQELPRDEAEAEEIASKQDALDLRTHYATQRC